MSSSAAKTGDRESFAQGARAGPPVVLGYMGIGLAPGVAGLTRCLIATVLVGVAAYDLLL